MSSNTLLFNDPQIVEQVIRAEREHAQRGECHVMLCCNNERGRFTGQLSQLQIGDGCEVLLSLEASYPDKALCDWVWQRGQPAFRVGRLGRLWGDIPVKRRCRHVGNIHWDLAVMSYDSVGKLLAAARDMRPFPFSQPEVAMFQTELTTEPLGELWNSCQPITASDIERAMEARDQ